MLNLSYTNLASLRTSVFDELTSLTSLNLDGNSGLTCLLFIPVFVERR